MEKSPRFRESEENLGAVNPIGSNKKTISTRLVIFNTGWNFPLTDSG